MNLLIRKLEKNDVGNFPEIDDSFIVNARLILSLSKVNRRIEYTVEDVPNYEITVDKKYRTLGVGKRLINQAKQWAKEGNMPGIMLETQNNNVAACKFYEKCGFVIGGFDFLVYKGLDMTSDEVAIYWYLHFE